MGWARTDVGFPDKCALLTFDDRDDVLIGAAMNAAWREFGEMPDKLQEVLTLLIISRRPELAGCVVLYMKRNYERSRFEIGVSHASLPKREFGSTPLELPLIPEVQPTIVE